MKVKQSILVVDDEPHIRRVLEVGLEKEGYRVDTADSAESALQMLAQSTYSAILSDVTMPGKSGYELLNLVKASTPDVPMILMTAYGTIPQAVQAIRDGAFEYIVKPFDFSSLKKVVAQAILPPARSAEPSTVGGGNSIIVKSPAMVEVIELAEQVADSHATVMLGGESGVGKEVIAKYLHGKSRRCGGPMISVSCAAIPESLMESELFGHEKGAFTGADAAKVGRFEAANGGTLFLDEIGEMPLSVQVKLLRVLQERHVERLGSNKSIPLDVRVITATHRDLDAAVTEGSFRLDLLYRLKVVEIAIPPLRERLEDLQPLSEHFISQFCKREKRSHLNLSAGVLKVFESYRWPGNVRELENVIERAVVIAPTDCTEIQVAQLPKPLQMVA